MKFFVELNARFTNLTPPTRAAWLMVLLLMELFLTSAGFDAQPLSKHSLSIFLIISKSAYLLRIAIVVIAAFFLLNIKRYKTVFLPFTAPKKYPSALLWFTVHSVLIICFWALCFLLYQSELVHQSTDEWLVGLIAVVWFVVGLSSLIGLMLTFSPLEVWLQFFRLEKRAFILSIVTGCVSWGISVLVEQSWNSLSSLTFQLSQQLLLLFYDTVIADLDNKILGTETFQVRIAPQCSGYEGIGLVIIFLSLYLWLARQQLRFPHVLLLFPIGIVLIWLLNVLRISLLIIIGSVFSPDIAIGGFHSNAGWIAFVLISTGIVLFAQRLSIFNKRPISLEEKEFQYNPASPLLMPFIVLMATVLISGAFISHFDWLYPTRVMTSLITLWLFRKHYKRIFCDFSGLSLWIGAIVFLIWIVLVPVSEKQDLLFINSLSAEPIVIQSAWLFFRFIGAAITVPVVEELVFRGYLIKKLVNSDFQTVRPGEFTWLSFVVSSLLFGVLHGNWLAGTLAGMCYAIALYRRGVMSDAISAHMTTNTLLAIYVIVSGHWSLW